jgi:hypothetical protein
MDVEICIVPCVGVEYTDCVEVVVTVDKEALVLVADEKGQETGAGI